MEGNLWADSKCTKGEMHTAEWARGMRSAIMKVLHATSGIGLSPWPYKVNFTKSTGGVLLSRTSSMNNTKINTIMTRKQHTSKQEGVTLSKASMAITYQSL